MDLQLLKDQCPNLIETSIEAMAPFTSDWTRVPGKPMAVALPRRVEDIVKILKFCTKHNVPVVPSGGCTGLAGGAVPSQGELVLNLSRMNKIFPVDILGRSVKVEAGAVTEQVHDHCAKHDLFWPIDLASKGSSEIGGNLATNAGGVRVIRYGMARRWVTGLTVVLMNGEILEINRGLEKNNTGYSLLQLMVGSEGTLGVIAEATLKLTRLPTNRQVFFFSVSSLQSIAELLEAARTGSFEINAFEFFSNQCLERVEEKLNRRSPLSQRGEYYLLMEVVSRSEVDTWLESVLSRQIVLDGTCAHSSDEQRKVWGLREGITESLALTGKVRKHDICVPVSKMVEYLEKAKKVCEKFPRKDLYLFGHFGDGSPHLNFVQPKGVSIETFNAECEKLDDEIFALTKSYGGTISSEHGIGLLKKAWLKYSRPETELLIYRSIKKAFDPLGLLNPGKVLPAPP